MSSSSLSAALTKPAATRMESKQQITNTISKSIIDQETRHRDDKTAKLRELRLAHEAAEALIPPPAPAKKKRAPASAAKQSVADKLAAKAKR